MTRHDVTTYVGAVAAGALVGGLVLALGATAVVWLLIAVSALALVAGAVDYVREHR